MSILRFSFLLSPTQFPNRDARERNRQEEIKELTSQGVVPHDREMEKHPEKSVQGRAWLIGAVSSEIREVLPAKTIVDNMIADAVKQLTRLSPKPKL